MTRHNIFSPNIPTSLQLAALVYYNHKCPLLVLSYVGQGLQNNCAHGSPQG